MTAPRDCTCERCVGACKRMPGRFAPGEAERAAAFLGVTLEELFRTRLVAEPYHYYGKGRKWRSVALAPHRTGGVLASLPEAARQRLSDLTVPLFAERPGNRPGITISSGEQGRCTFLTTDDRCEIHPVKPRECRETLCCDGVGGIETTEAVYSEWRRPGPRAQVRRLLKIASVVRPGP